MVRQPRTVGWQLKELKIPITVLIRDRDSKYSFDFDAGSSAWRLDGRNPVPHSSHRRRLLEGTGLPAPGLSGRADQAFLGNPFQGARFTRCVEVDVRGLNVMRGRPGVFVIPGGGSAEPLGRIVSSGGV